MKQFNYLLLIIFILSFSAFSFAQQICGSDGIRQKQLQDPSFVRLEKAVEKKMREEIENNDFSRMTNTVLTIPVVVHVLHLGETVGSGTNISDAQIQSSIDNLNYMYRGQSPASPVDFHIEFALAQRDPNCMATTGINRVDASGVPNYATDGMYYASSGADEHTLMDLSRWPETDYFNIWIVSEIDGNNGGGGYQGYAYYFNGAAYTGSVMMYTVFGNDPTNANPSWPLTFSRDNSTVVHEAGHYFHLHHTFQGDGNGGTCPADITSVGINANSDGCADTVPHRRETSTCPANNSCAGGNPWVDNNTINNIMSYYSCTDRLTNDQRTRIRSFMEGTSIVGSKGAEPVDPSYAAPVAVCLTNSPAANNLAGIFSVELNGVTFSSSTTGIDGGNIDDTANCSKYFQIDTSVSNTLNVGVGSNFNQVGVWIDWNDDGDFNDDAEFQGFAQDIADSAVESFVLSYPSVIPYNDYVRIRIIEDLDDRYGPGLINNSPCYQSLVYGQSEDYTIYIEPSGSLTYTYNNTWSPSNPVGVSTAGDHIVVNAGTANIFANTDCNTLIVNPGAGLTIDSGVTLTATTVDLNSTSQLFSSLISDGTITGTVNYNKHVSQIGTNDLVSAPVVGQTFVSFDTANANLAASGTIRAFAPYNTVVGDYQNYDLITNAITTIDAGTGYRIATTDGSTLTFTGNVRTNDVLDVPISDATAGSAWNLIGNPYPSYLHFDAFFAANYNELDPDNAYQAIYGYDGSASNGWTVWNFSSIVDISADEYIAPGQAFFVKSKTGGGLIDFTTIMRTVQSSDDFILGRQSATNVALCRLNLNSATNNASTKIYFIEGTTKGLDVGYDAGSYLGSAAEYSIFSNLVEDNSGLDMAIQALPYNDFNDVSVPIGVNAQAGISLTIGVDNTSTLPSHINVYLEDNVANTFTLLNDSDYSFVPSSDLNGTGRFYLRYSSSALSLENNELNNLQIYTTKLPKEILVKGLLKAETKANLYDIRGRLVLSGQLEKSSNSNTIDISTLSSGIYIIKVSNAHQVKTQKLVIE